MWAWVVNLAVVCSVVRLEGFVSQLQLLKQADSASVDILSVRYCCKELAAWSLLRNCVVVPLSKEVLELDGYSLRLFLWWNIHSLPSFLNDSWNFLKFEVFLFSYYHYSFYPSVFPLRDVDWCLSFLYAFSLQNYLVTYWKISRRKQMGLTQ